VLLNGLQTSGNPGGATNALSQGRVWADIARLELIESLKNVFPYVSYTKLLFGSYYPLMNFEAALLKLVESVLTQTQLEAIMWKNAGALVPWSTAADAVLLKLI
jgi:hypothetical protein